MKRYAGIIKNDVVNGNGMCVSFFVQGCPLHCPDCHNEEDWDFDGGLELPDNYLETISEALTANNIQRNFSLLGGEPLCEENLDLSLEILRYVRSKFKDIDICVWSGYQYESLIARNDKRISEIFEIANVLVDGPFQITCRNITLKMRGSENQRLIDLDKSTKENIVIKEYER
jgi:anaerobic ribonucleoside-triphosphate reductase activating protein